MKSLWLTYAWEDNKEGDVDYIAQEISREDVKVKLDRWNLTAGKRVWEQISAFIQNPAESDAWLIYATQNSLGSEACKEELAYALDRALSTRGEDFPIIALFSSSVDTSLIPASIRIRLFINLTDPDWKERIISAVEKHPPKINPQLEPYYFKIYRIANGSEYKYGIEVRPRAGTWSPFLAAIPLSEKEKVDPFLAFGPSGGIPHMFTVIIDSECAFEDKWCIVANNEATPTQSYYMICKKLPTMIIFGSNNGPMQHHVNIPVDI